jgi:hypothetical protein
VGYLADRRFTDTVHRRIAIPKVYQPRGWVEVKLDPTLQLQLDNQVGIDYVFASGTNRFSVQERFRELKYQNYTDFTIRYQRPSDGSVPRPSEFFKIQADYFLYGITNGTKSNLKSNTDFIKVALVNFGAIRTLFDNGTVVVDVNLSGKTMVHNSSGVIRVPVINNSDNSSSFVPIDVPTLVASFGNKIVEYQRGF